MHLQNAPIYYAKYKKQESEVKALMKLKKEEGLAEITATKEKNENMRRSVTLEHRFRDEETQETDRRKKKPRWILCFFKERRRNYMKSEIYLNQQLIKGTFAVKRYGK